MNAVKLAELTSGVGALLLGVGLGAWFAAFLDGFATAILVTGIALHAWGMWQKHRLEAAIDDAMPAWVQALYWVCWLALALIVAFLVARLVI